MQDSGDLPERKTRSVSNSLSIMLREECGELREECGELRSTNDAIYAGGGRKDFERKNN